MELKEIEIDGSKLRKLRKDQRMSLQAVADQIGVERGTIYNYEKGNAKPSANMLARLCALYQVEIHELTNFEISPQVVS